ncbi:MAG: DUF1611 domain-containing protein [Gammaproteobacteria bacterium]|nr:DUF1611 domain-containing protein [Gammaproteobacteria bacterium]NIR83440.1 DUF1611 domain-containing protein [Gammaproteobacteria bacterium]NIR91362.1 DUF1611 domain-containing protein [Gammaproteobacteria bacterium]NIU04602.1 DUF1611 domain-containing protein [Gammaproteobacteria bacterium]NIV51644.1 DUF1611 domain-containing protein [Gammaproteobacteria bacterium]
MASSPAIILAYGVYRSHNGKVAHGLVRGGDRFRVTAVVDPESAGNDAGVLLDGAHRNIPVVNSISEAIECSQERPHYCVVGVATHGGRFTPELRRWLVEAARAGLSVVNGLHDFAADDPDVASAARDRGVQLIDLRRPRPRQELRFWTGEIRTVHAPRIAVLGTDCALGKRTTTRFVLDALNRAGIRAEMIYTGQTGWMQGARYGFVLDSVVNDFVCGELEHAIVRCDREVNPDVILIEGQSSLRNPSGPCGAEFLVSGEARGVILQHAPAREFFEGYAEKGFRIPPIEQEVQLVGLYGAHTLAITIQREGMDPEQLAREQREIEARLDIPVVRPLEEGVDRLVPIVQRFIAEERR